MPRRASWFLLTTLVALAGCRDAAAPAPAELALTLVPAKLRFAPGDTVITRVTVRNTGVGALRYTEPCGVPPVTLHIYVGARQLASTGQPICLDAASAPRPAGVLAPGDSLQVTLRWRAVVSAGGGVSLVAPGTYGLQGVWRGEPQEVRSAPVLIEVQAPSAP